MLLKAVIAFLLVPGIFAGIFPIAIVESDPWRSDGFAGGTVFIITGLLLLLRCIRDFYVSGKGTLAPWAPPRRLVVVGLYQYTRNPMYLAVLTLLSGMVMVFYSPLLLIYTVVLAIIFHLRTIYHEEPWLASRFASDWQAFAKAVPRWLPRLSAWNKQPH